MTDDSRTLSALTELLDELPTRAPDRLLATVLDGVQAAPQRGGWRSLGAAVELVRDPFVPGSRLVWAALVLAGLLLAVAAVLVGGQLLERGPAPLLPPARGAFTPTGSMAVGRGGATGTLLSDGRVLVVGGESLERQADGTVPSIGGYRTNTKLEIWDPGTGTFNTAGQLVHARSGQTATLLDDGRVLIVGGDRTADVGDSMTSAEIWDPASMSSRPTGPLAVVRYGATARLLADGRVLVRGGTDSNGDDVASAEVWDPATETFGPAGSIPEASYPIGTLLDDGRIFTTTGLFVDVWDPATGTSSRAAPLTQVHDSRFTATLLQDGRVLIVGGQRARDQGTESAEIWDPTTLSSTPTGSLIHARAGHAAVLLDDGRVLVLGNDGRIDDGTSAEVFHLK